MTQYEILSIVIAGVSGFISIVALIVSVVSFVKSNAIATGNIELFINERITTTKQSVVDISMQMAALTAKESRTSEEEEQFRIYSLALQNAVENNINAYEEACAKYIDGKVDRKRFEKIYRTEIRQLVDNKELAEYFSLPQSRYRAILRVYDEWENLER